jgi:AraC-like DNA-binding protein
LAVTTRRAAGASTGRDLRIPGWLGLARELLHARYSEASIRVADLAAEADVHPVYFARAFRAHYGQTPGAYIRHLRLTRAAKELAGSETPVSQIALDAGFADQSHLSRSFRKMFGVTPGRWRELHRS